MKRTTLCTLLIFGSGLCALVYQSTWVREFRLIFGASTAASAAVLAIFMGGICAGSLALGRRADKHDRPLLFYAHLELLIALTAALTPLLLFAIRHMYLSAGGTPRLGLAGGSVVRLLLAGVVIGLPTFLMGGTLPAAALAIEAAQDVRRRRVALLYGFNTLGAVCGAMLSTFVLFERLGNRQTLWLACLINVAIALAAWFMSHREGTTKREQSRSPMTARESDLPAVPKQIVYVGAAVTGLIFLLMEIIWYRMLAPLLGGTSFTFGLILATALLGIGLGGTFYAFSGANRTPSLIGFALTCSLEALFIGIPLALGDRVAILAMLLRPLASLGFGGLVLGWTAITSLVVLPASFIAGFQFPLLIALLGKGTNHVGHDVGRAYAWNTAGAVLGALAGGFGLLPALTASGSWRFAVVTLVAVASATALLESRRSRVRSSLASVFVLSVLAVALVALPVGPTAVWRHSAIGAGRADEFDLDVNELENWKRYQRRTLIWESEGVESSVGLSNADGLAFHVNGKIDGNARGDAGTQVMSGLIGALLHPNTENAMVIGLGTGSTAGWLAAVPSIRTVDVIELEPSVLEVARRCAAVNADVMNNPKARVFIGDAREVVLTTSKRYDLIFSEPSNPYRAGIANLYTREFYEAVSKRLHSEGLFLQWVQAYEIDRDTIGTIYATLLTVFPHLDTFKTQDGDLVLVAAKHALRYDTERLRQRIAMEPYATAMGRVWRNATLEGFLAHYVSSTSFARSAAKGARINTDDHPIVEFAFARQVGTDASVDIEELRAVALSRKEHRPPVAATVDWRNADRERSFSDPEEYIENLPTEATDIKLADATNTLLLAMYAEVLADSANPAAIDFLAELEKTQPAESDIIMARLRWREGLIEEAASALESGYRAYRNDPWPLRPVMRRGLEVAIAIAAQDRPELTRRIHEALREPFSTGMLNEERIETLEVLSRKMESPGCGPLSIASLERFEPHTPFNRAALQRRRDCYVRSSHHLAGVAMRELSRFDRSAARPVSSGFTIP